MTVEKENMKERRTLYILVLLMVFEQEAPQIT